MKEPKRFRNWDSKKVKKFRKCLGRTQAELAEDLGVRQQTVSEWETGLYTPRGASAKLLGMLAERAGFSYRAESGEEKP